MSATIQQIPTFSPANPNDSDTYGEDCTREMTARGTTIASIGATPTIVNSPSSAGAFTVSNITVLAGGLSYAFHGAGGDAGARYTITFALTLADGNLINRTVIVPVAQYVG